MATATNLKLIDSFPVSGRSTSQEVFDRLPVQELAADQPYQWTLFILGWAFIKNTPIPFPGVVQPPFHEATSFMEVGGIHGKPYREWPGDRRTPEEAKVDFSYDDKKDMYPSPSRFGGYCHHAAITFPSWHRPYVMLIEQAIGEYAENIAQQIENVHPGEVGRWVKEAKQLRFPYWDWADPKVDTEGLPTLFYMDELKIVATGKQYVTVPNPLASFTLPYIPPDFADNNRGGIVAYFSQWAKTYRHAGSSQHPDGSNYKELNANLKQSAANIRTSTGMLFTFPDNGNSGMIYDEFSNTRNQSLEPGQSNSTGSVEAVHNTMHVILGGNGNMSFPDYAGFDPIFFFHHSNLDRLLALWEWCYPNYWMGDGYDVDGTVQPWTLENGTYSTAYSQQIDQQGKPWGSLVPFKHPDGRYWTNTESRFFTPDAYPKYYSYKEFLGVSVDRAASPTARQEARAKIARYYNVNPRKDVSTIHSPSWTHITVPSSNDVDLPPNFEPIENFRIFRVLVRLAEHSMGTSYRFNLYYKEELIGSVVVFARENNSPCNACAVRRTAASIVRGVITIPSHIINDIIVHSNPPRGENTMATTMDSITQALTGKLVDSTGRVIASAQGGSEATPVPASQAAPRSIHPVEISLTSAAVAEHTADENQPVHFFDWQRHVDVFPSGWKDETSQAPAPAAAED